MNENKDKLKQRPSSAEHSRKKLRHGKADNRETRAEKIKNRRMVMKGRKKSYRELGFKREVREQVMRNEDENAGTDSLKEGMNASDAVISKTKDRLYVRKIRYEKESSERDALKRASEGEVIPGEDRVPEASMTEKAGGRALKGDAVTKETTVKEGSNALSREYQKKRIRRSYYQGRKEAEEVRSEGSRIAKGVMKFIQAVRELVLKAAESIASNPEILVVILISATVVAVMAFMFTSCTTVAASMSNAVSATSYTAYDEDILAVDKRYTDKEKALKRQIDNTPSLHPGYDEYEYFLDEIGHNPYELASYLTSRYEDYKKRTVDAELNSLFDEQYKLTFTPRTEERTRTVERTGSREVRNSDGTVSYEEYTYEEEETYTVRILTVKLENKSLGNVIRTKGMSPDELNRYMLLLNTKGNKDYLFADIYTDYDNPDEYHVPGSALSDQQFAMMISVGERFLGRAYVWGGSSPSTGFDCSGFVSYVLNHSGWNVGRRSAAGLRAMCTIVSESEAKPGDLIFFKGTYNTSGASHVGIYVGNGMMLHCGNPIQYTSVETRYWKNHFFGYGKLP